MKLLCLTVGLLLAWSVDAASEPTFWVGECQNKTTGDMGFLRMSLVEDDAGTSPPKFNGYLSVSGWLGGGGGFAVTPTEGVYKFQTMNVAPIDWSGKINETTLSGTYSVTAQGSMPEQAGEFTLKPVPVKPGSEGVFRQILAILTEAHFNEPSDSGNDTSVDRKQMLFDQVHPVGTATSVRVTDVDIDWQEGSNRESIEDVRRFTVDLTLYWIGIIERQGQTKMRLNYNAELDEVTNYTVIETNGVTKEKAGKLAKEIGLMVGAAAMKAYLEAE